jgi:glycosyltransferase involved in cell wall biosynthesis
VSRGVAPSTFGVPISSTVNPRLSIVTACRNQRRYITQTLESVISQTYSPIEHIVVDGGSTDGTVDVLKRYAANYNLRWVSEPDRGLSHAFNKGVAAATGEWLYFLNGDDYVIDNGAIARVMEWIAAHPGYSIYMGGIAVVDEEGVEIARSPLPRADTIYTRDALLNEGAPVIHQGTFYQRQVFEVAGSYSEKYRTHMDYEFHLRATKYFDIAAMELVVACFRTHPLALSKQADWRRYVELLRARAKHGGSLWHRDNLYFLRGFFATWPATRWLYHWLGGTRRKIVARLSGSHVEDGLD